jgi:hypothetical protein
MRILAFAIDTASATRILQPLGEPAWPPPVSPAWGLPEGEESFDPSPAYDPFQSEPDLGFEFDQTLS